MVVNQKVTGRASSMPVGLLLGAVSSLTISVGGAAICGALISKEVFPESAIGYCAMLLILLSAVVGPALAVGRIKRRRLFVCVMSGVIYYGVLLSITALFFGGQYQGMGVTALLVMAGSTLVVMTGLRRERKPKYRRHRQPAR